jgi:hypothetical protein
MKLVGGAGNAPVVTSGVIFFDTPFTDRQPDHVPVRKLEIRNSKFETNSNPAFG